MTRTLLASLLAIFLSSSSNAMAQSGGGSLVDCGACQLKTSGHTVGSLPGGYSILIVIGALTDGTCHNESEGDCKQSTGCSADTKIKTEDANGNPVVGYFEIQSAEVGFGRSKPASSSPAWQPAVPDMQNTGTLGNKDVRDEVAGCGKYSYVEATLSFVVVSPPTPPGGASLPATVTLECDSYAPVVVPE